MFIKENETRSSFQIKQERHRILNEMRTMIDGAEKQNRNLDAQERQRYEAADQQFRNHGMDLLEREEAEQRAKDAATPIRGGGPASNGGQVRRLAATDSYAEHIRSTRGNADELSFGRLVRGLATGNWRGAEMEHRAMTGAADANGNVLLSEHTAGRIIDLSRAASVLNRAGAQTVPMEQRKVRVPRLLTDMKPQWLPELAEADEDQPTFDALELEAKTVRVYAEISEELLEDSENVDDTFIEQHAAVAIAQEIDRVGLYGSGVGEEPRGLLNQPGVTIAGTGASVASWADIVGAQAALRGRNFEPTAAVLAPESEASLTLATGNDGQYLQPPVSVATLNRVVSSSVPSNLGAQSNRALLAVADWRRLVIGWRSDVRVKTYPLAKRYGVGLEIAARIDVGIERAGAFDLRLVKATA